MWAKLRLQVRARHDLETAVFDGRIVERERARDGAGVRCARRPITEVLMPGEDGLRSLRAFGQKLIVVELCVLADRLLRDGACALLEHVVAERWPVHAR